GHAREDGLAAVVEVQAGADDRPVRRARGEDLARRRERADARGDVDSHPADVVAEDLALARVQPDAHVEALRAHDVAQRVGAADGAARRAPEDREEAIADALD